MWITLLPSFFFFSTWQKNHATLVHFLPVLPQAKATTWFCVWKRQKQENNILFFSVTTNVCFNTVSCATNRLRKTCKYSILKNMWTYEFAITPIFVSPETAAGFIIEMNLTRIMTIRKVLPNNTKQYLS